LNAFYFGSFGRSGCFGAENNGRDLLKCGLSVVSFWKVGGPRSCFDLFRNLVLNKLVNNEQRICGLNAKFRLPPQLLSRWQDPLLYQGFEFMNNYRLSKMSGE